MIKTIAEQNAILISIVGSTLYGLNTVDSDVDHMGIMIEPVGDLIGISKPVEQWVDPAGDYTIYGLRKFCQLALNGNPTILQLLYAPESHLISLTREGRELRDLRDAFLSKRTISAHLGYLIAQQEKLISNRQQRPELISRYGYDTKFAMHALRLGAMGYELGALGTLTLPMEPSQRDFLRRVRHGEMELDRVMNLIKFQIMDLKNLLHYSTLPEKPDVEKVETWMIEKYLEKWG